MERMKLDMKSFIGGICVGSVLFSGIAYAAGNNNVIEVELNKPPFTYYFDGVPKSLANGHTGFMYKNSVHVPIRFVSENLGKTIMYDPKTASVYIGKLPVTKMYSKLEAVDIVKKKFGKNLPPQATVRYDHDDEQGNYIIHISEQIINNFQTGDSYTKTYGWYSVNPRTGAATKLF